MAKIARSIGFPFFRWNEEPLEDGSRPFTHRRCPECDQWVNCDTDHNADAKHWFKYHAETED